MRAFIRGLDISLIVPAYVLNGAHGHRANDLHFQNSSTTRPAECVQIARGLFSRQICRCRPAHRRKAWGHPEARKQIRMVGSVSVERESCLGLQPSPACATTIRNNLQNRRGANSTHPVPRHREAPVTQARQAAPDWARARSVV